MCQKGVNNDQFKLLIGQADDTLAMVQQWLEQLHHIADHAEMSDPSTEIAQAGVLLGEVRAKLDGAIDRIDGATGGPGADVSVELV